MPLTPADVHNVAFSKPPIGKRGYNEDEVDQFLDLVEDTLAELQDENSDLKLKVEQLESGSAKGAGVAGAASAAGAAGVSKVDEAALRRQIETELRGKFESEYSTKLEQARKDLSLIHI